MADFYKYSWAVILITGIILAAGCTGTEPENETGGESVDLSVSRTSDTITVIATNIGHVESSFEVFIDCYDKDNIKFDGTTVQIPWLESGERGKGSSRLPRGTASYRVSDVLSSSRAGDYRVYFNVDYI